MNLERLTPRQLIRLMDPKLDKAIESDERLGYSIGDRVLMNIIIHRWPYLVHRVAA